MTETTTAMAKTFTVSFNSDERREICDALWTSLAMDKDQLKRAMPENDRRILIEAIATQEAALKRLREAKPEA